MNMLEYACVMTIQYIVLKKCKTQFKNQIITNI